MLAMNSSDALVMFNVGDSRCYRFGPSGLAQLSHDDVASAATQRFPKRQACRHDCDTHAADQPLQANRSSV